MVPLVWTGWSGEAFRESEQLPESSEAVSHGKISGESIQSKDIEVQRQVGQRAWHAREGKSEG